MASKVKFDSSTALVTVINKGVPLADLDRAAGDYDNSLIARRDLYANFFLRVQYDGSAPLAGALVAELYIIPSDEATIPVFGFGGDGAVGLDKNPAKGLLVWTFESIDPSTSVDEELPGRGISLEPGPNRMVLRNISGEIFDSTWTLRMNPFSVGI